MKKIVISIALSTCMIAGVTTYEALSTRDNKKSEVSKPVLKEEAYKLIEEDGKFKLLDTKKNSYVVSSWHEIDGNRYYFDQDGYRATGWFSDGEKTYYADEKGILKTGWFSDEGKSYYLNTDGSITTGVKEIDSISYCFLDDGAMAVNTTVNGIYYDNEGHPQESKKSDILVVNKKHPLPLGYAPGEDPVAGQAIRKLINEMQTLGYDISNEYSGYRSYEVQSGLYQSYVASNGQAQADTFSARPGYSEHQTGLAFDLKHSGGALVTGARESQWIEENAYKYGFIVRYKEGWESITGYMAEPWHLRYVGDEAQAIYESGLTLEEYLNVPGGDYE